MGSVFYNLAILYVQNAVEVYRSPQVVGNEKSCTALSKTVEGFRNRFFTFVVEFYGSWRLIIITFYVKNCKWSCTSYE